MLSEKASRLPETAAPAVTVPIAGGGTRVLDVVPWDLAQLPHVLASIAFAQLAEEYRRAAMFQDAVDTCRAGLAIHPSYLSARVTL